jgi:hypothetical protein
MDPLLEFNVPWEINKLAQAVFEGISDSQPSNISMVGTFSSHRLSQLVGGLLDYQLTLDFRRLMYSASLAYVRSSSPHYEDSMNVAELHHISYLAGYDLVNALDLLFSPQSLAKSHLQRIRALFLLSFGTLLAIHYSHRLIDSPPFPGYSNDSTTTKNDQTLWDAMQDHLCLMLAHHLVFLGSRIGFTFQPDVEKKLLTTSVCKWLPEGSFTWKPHLMAGNIAWEARCALEVSDMIQVSHELITNVADRLPHRPPILCNIPADNP